MIQFSSKFYRWNRYGTSWWLISDRNPNPNHIRPTYIGRVPKSDRTYHLQTLMFFCRSSTSGSIQWCRHTNVLDKLKWRSSTLRNSAWGRSKLAMSSMRSLALSPTSSALIFIYIYYCIIHIFKVTPGAKSNLGLRYNYDCKLIAFVNLQWLKRYRIYYL